MKTKILKLSEIGRTGVIALFIPMNETKIILKNMIRNYGMQPYEKIISSVAEYIIINFN
jgi:hypothetical protein